MKFRVTFKDPDGPADCLQEEAQRIVDAIPGVKDSLDDDEREALIDSKQEKLTEFAARWLDCGEYVTVEFDTEAGTAVVVPRK